LDAVVICDEIATNQAVFEFWCPFGKGTHKREDMLRRASKGLIQEYALCKRYAINYLNISVRLDVCSSCVL